MNELFPVFLKAEALRILIVGGGAVGEEKLGNLLRSSPQARVRLVAPDIRDGVRTLAAGAAHVELVDEVFRPDHLDGVDVAVLATADNATNRRIRDAIKNSPMAGRVLVNVADTPDLCDFYMGSIVTRGDLKLAISTNGKSPTLAKRMRELLEDVLPDEISALLDNLQVIRDRLEGDFQAKVKALNDLTASLIENPEPEA